VSLSDKQLAGNQRRTLRAMRLRLLAMSSDWDGRDQFNMQQLQDLADRHEAVAVEMIADDPATD
jgi:hypothetical protein